MALTGLISAATMVPGPARLASAQAVAASWSYTGNLNTGRTEVPATLLPSGKVLVVGGGFSSAPNSWDLTAELYDPAAGTWSVTGSAPRSLITDPDCRLGCEFGVFNHTATLLPNGKVLVAGGTMGDGSFKIAELYDSATGTWGITDSLITRRESHTATLLPNGKVLIAAGFDYDYNSLNSAELYDPATGTWSSTGSLNASRVYHTATLLPSGKVLVVGGFDQEGSKAQPVVDVNLALNTAELYDPTTGTWSIKGSLNTARLAHTATLLPNGKVLVAAGSGVNHPGGLNSAELYDPDTGTWSSTGNLNTARESRTATLLPSGKVLLVGNDSAELYDPATGTWGITSSPNKALIGPATLLPNGKVLVASGNTAVLYDPGTNPISNPIDDARSFVRQHYLDFLNREPDADGLAYWTDRITQCGSDARCTHDRRIGVSAAFFIELEFQDTGYYVYRFYKASFGRQPNYAEFTSDRSKVIGGSSLEANKQAFADEWAQRDAFRQAYPITMSNTEVVKKLFDTAGLTAPIYDAQRQQEIQALNAGRSRALVLRDVIEISDFRNIPDPQSPRYSEVKQISQYNPAFVLMQYFGYLRRNQDQGGYDFWLDVVNNREPNNYRGMVCSFITSTEYQLRFGTLVTHGNSDCAQ